MAIKNLKNYLSPVQFFNFIKTLLKKRKLIFSMAKDDFRKDYLESYFGLFWAVAQPAAYVLTIWFIFSMGFRGGSRGGEHPFVLYLVSGFIFWTFFSSSVSAGSASVSGYSYLVKKMVFAVSILPVVKIVSGIFIHLIFLGLYFIVYFGHGYMINIYFLQIPYYIFSAFVLLLGIGWLSSSISIFVKDLSQFISVMMRIGFWFTPIFWKIDQFKGKLNFILKLNPAYYLVNGYRDVFLNKIWFWERPHLTLYYWSLTLIIFVTGAIVFKKLRPHFADVL